LPFEARTAPTESLEYEIPAYNYPLLQFWTLAILMDIRINPSDFHSGGYLMDGRGAKCGDIELDAFGAMPFYNAKGIYNAKGPFEVILLSEEDDEEYNVMLLEWNGHVAERNGIGTLKKTAVAHRFPPGAVWKEILLG